MFNDPEGPIEHFEWGRFIIGGQVHSMDGEGAGKDILIADGKVHAWKARHGHRLKPEMVTAALDHDIDVLVIGSGVRGAIDVLKKTRQAIRDAGVQTLVVEKTPEACAIYNRLVREGKKVTLLAHGTC